MERRYIELLHMLLNLSNQALGLLSAQLQYFLHRNGEPRDRDAHPGDAWAACYPATCSHKPEWKQAGASLDDAIVEQHGAKYRRPLTSYHGNQCRKLCSAEGVKLALDYPPVARGLERLYSVDAEARAIIGHTRGMIAAVGRGMDAAHRAPGSDDKPAVLASLRAVRDAARTFRQHADALSQDQVPLPCRKTWALYDHVFVFHLESQMKAAADRGESLAQFGTSSLEGLNRPVKELLRRFLGGGGAPRDEGDHSNEPLVGVLRQADAVCRLGRMKEYASLHVPGVAA